jgi:CRP-like cAMP-binding protein
MSRYKTLKPDAAMLNRAAGYLNKFTLLEPADMLELASYCEFRQFDKRTIIVKEGEVDDYLNMVIKGLVLKYVRVKKSRPILQMATEGHLISSEVSFLTRTPSQVFIETLEPTVLISMRFNKMEEALKNYTKGEEIGRKMLEQMYIRKDERKFTWMIMNTRERFLDYINNHPHMLQRVPQKYLASYLNIQPETFSRLKHLVRKKA